LLLGMTSVYSGQLQLELDKYSAALAAIQEIK
jgi:hypothetical protein